MKFQILNKIRFTLRNYLNEGFTLRNYRNEGFSMIEMLVVISLLGVISVIVTQVLVISVRSTLKSEVQKEVKQNGDYALSVMQRAIRNASDISIGCNVSSNRVVLTNPNLSTTTFTCDNTTKKITSGVGDLTNDKVAVSTTGCLIFHVVCPSPPTRSKYVYINFSLKQAGTGTDPNSSASVPYQSTVELRTSTQ